MLGEIVCQLLRGVSFQILLALVQMAMIIALEIDCCLLQLVKIILTFSMTGMGAGMPSVLGSVKIKPAHQKSISLQH